MSYKPTKTFNGVQGEASVDSGGPAYLSHDIEELTKMFDPSSTHSIDTDHPTAQPGGINKEHLSFTITNDYDNTEKAHVATAYTHANITNANPHATKASHITNTAIEGVSGVNVQAALEGLKDIADTKADTSDMNLRETIANANLLVKTVAFEESTGRFTFTTQGGTQTIIDTNLEKVPGTMALVEDPSGSGTYYLVIYDRSTPPIELSRCPVTALFNAINVEDTATISLSLVADSAGKKKLTANVKDGSITLAKLESSIMTTIQQYTATASAAATTASAAATNAGTSATNASTSESNALSYARNAQTYATNASDSATYAATYANNASTSANNASTSASTASSKATLSESWAVGGTGTRSGEDINNSKYWAEQAAEAASGSGAMQKLQYDPTTEGVTTPVLTAGGIPAYVSGKVNTRMAVADYDSSEAVKNAGGIVAYITNNAVKYTASQSLTDSQKATARNNIGLPITSLIVDDGVLYLTGTMYVSNNILYLI